MCLQRGLGTSALSSREQNQIDISLESRLAPAEIADGGRLTLCHNHSELRQEGGFVFHRAACQWDTPDCCGSLNTACLMPGTLAHTYPAYVLCRIQLLALMVKLGLKTYDGVAPSHSCPILDIDAKYIVRTLASIKYQANRQHLDIQTTNTYLITHIFESHL